ncbi:MAG: peptidylprolyl isomerase [Deltaproteobacteria bacterium]|nr:peptidylprolyl isomerase [Deltaproteobacteria bacterium]
MRTTTFGALVLSFAVVACKPASAPPPPPLPAKTEAVKPPPPKPEAPKPEVAAGSSAGALDPAKLTETAPAKFTATFDTSAGTFEVEVSRELAPQGADRFFNLVKSGFYDENRFFRVAPGFVVQWGLHADPAVNGVWREAHIKDDPVKDTNKRGNIVFATAGPDTRTTQLFINLKDNAFLDAMGFAPFGKVTKGMEVVDKITSEYGETPNQMMIQMQGNAYLKQSFPKLDFIKKASIKG